MNRPTCTPPRHATWVVFSRCGSQIVRIDVAFSADPPRRSRGRSSPDHIAQEHVADMTQAGVQISLSRGGGRGAVAAGVHDLEGERIQVYASTDIVAAACSELRRGARDEV